MNKFENAYNKLDESLNKRKSVDMRQLQSAMEKLKHGRLKHANVSLTFDEVEALLTSMSKQTVGKSFE